MGILQVHVWELVLHAGVAPVLLAGKESTSQSQMALVTRHSHVD